MSRLLRLILFSTLLLPFYLAAIDQAASEPHPTYFILDMPNTPDKLPRNFRTTHDSYKFSSPENPTQEGLDRLFASGSGQFSQNGLKTLLARLKNPPKLIIVDLRQESHGFANGIAVSWFAPKNWGNVGKTQKQVEEDENRRLSELLKKKNVILHAILQKNIDGTIAKMSEEPLVVHQVANESQMADSFQVGYFRVCVTDHVRPSNQDVERFVDFVDHLEPKTWLHFHCEAGEGRTTTFLAMYDMLRNAREVSFDAIIKRQYLLGGHDFAKMPEVNTWQYPLAAEKLLFLKQFYEYSRTKSRQNKSWMAYILKKAEELGTKN